LASWYADEREVPSFRAAILDTVEGADLVVVGLRGHGGFAGLLLGSVNQQNAHHAPAPSWSCLEGSRAH
jgi:nucleotide-binding universal stress UspA family protein